jgi:hypothetical protein
MTTKRNIRCAAAVALGFAAPWAAATNGDHMLGLTAVQNGMAGAVVAAPQDAATVLVNPAGIAELDIKEVRFDLGLGFLNPPRKVNGYDSDSDYYMMPAGAVAFRVNDSLTLGMGLGGLSGMGVDFADTAAAAGNQAVVTTKQFFKVAPGFAYRFSDALSVGATINLNYQSLALYTPQFALPQNQVFGWGLTAGMIWKLNDRLQLGAAWSSKQRMNEFEWNTAGTPTGSGKISMRMDAPQTLALGVAFRPMPGLLVEGDVKRIWFSKVLGRLHRHRSRLVQLRLEQPDRVCHRGPEGHRRQDAAAGGLQLRQVADRGGGRQCQPWFAGGGGKAPRARGDAQVQRQGDGLGLLRACLQEQRYVQRGAVQHHRAEAEPAQLPGQLQVLTATAAFGGATGPVGVAADPVVAGAESQGRRYADDFGVIGDFDRQVAAT